jgi:hypothetical protein
MEECLGVHYVLTDKQSTGVHISYGALTEDAISIPDDGLLWKQGAGKYALDKATGWGDSWNETIPFDLLSTTFYLLSRMEEWGPFEGDRHGRFPAKASVLAQSGWLQKPVIDGWMEQLRKLLNNRFGLHIPIQGFRFRPTYDIDIAYSYLHKGTRRTVGGILRDLKSGEIRSVRARLRALSGRVQDPYDAFVYLRALHEKYRLAPTHFVLAAAKPGPYDKNVSPQHPAMRALVQGFAMEGSVGIHPSYNSSEQSVLTQQEKSWMEDVVAKPVVHSRQHYIRLRFPDTYRSLLAAGISEDWSMGYPDALGFRAGTSRSFRWYDVGRDEQTDLRIHPFAFMDTTARDYQGLSAEDAFIQLRELSSAVAQVGGTLTTIFHNFSLGTAPDWPGWREHYESFVAETATNRDVVAGNKP